MRSSLQTANAIRFHFAPRPRAQLWRDVGRSPDHRADDDADPHARPGRRRPGRPAGRRAAARLAALGHLPTILACRCSSRSWPRSARMYRDSEMASGSPAASASRASCGRCCGRAGRCCSSCCCWRSSSGPGSNQRGVELKERYERRSDLSRVAAGQFQSSADGKRVFFIDRDTDDARVGRNVFVLTLQGDTEAVTSARAGRIEVEGDDRFILLERGQRNEQDLKTGERRRRGSRATARGPTTSCRRCRRAAADRAQHARAAAPADPAVPGRARLAHRTGARRRQPSAAGDRTGRDEPAPPGQAWNLLLGLLAFVVYFNLINLSQAWIATGKAGMGAMLAAIHGSMFLLALALLWWRDHASTSRLFSPRRGAA